MYGEHAFKWVAGFFSLLETPSYAPIYSRAQVHIINPLINKRKICEIVPF
jgi:hypothetical protein